MKIAQVSATFPPYLGGTGNVCYHNSVELGKLGHDVVVFTSNYPEEFYNYPDFLSVRRFKPWLRVGNAPLIPQLSNIKDFDVIHLHFPFYFGAELIYLTSKFRNQPYVVTYHQDVIFNGVLNLFQKIHTSSFMRVILGNASKIFVTSLDYAENSVNKDVLMANPDRLVELPNGVDIDRFHPAVDGSSIWKRYSIENQRVLLFVGGLDKAHYFKGVDYLLKSFAMLDENDTKLVIVGDGDLRAHYEAMSRGLGISSRTIFTGRVSNDDLPKYYAASDMLILPSTTMGEAFGMVLLEAMATGKPVIASNLPGVRTVVDDGLNGLLITPKNIEELASKIKLLLENKNVRMKFGKVGRKKVEAQYSWNKIGKLLEESYCEILA